MTESDFFCVIGITAIFGCAAFFSGAIGAGWRPWQK
jgi:hypothetical protein